jgi:vacuolar-type H+-ATPase subunit E/Vma4
MKQDASFFEGKEAILIYIAKKLRDALRLETVLAEAGIDYGVETDQYSGGVIFKSLRTGAFFYVLPETVDRARAVLQQHGFKPHVE